eukprot:3083634-Amphidinium_carterae.1
MPCEAHAHRGEHSVPQHQEQVSASEDAPFSSSIILSSRLARAASREGWASLLSETSCSFPWRKFHKHIFTLLMIPDKLPREQPS